jgi:DDE superfamily endonuclease
MGALHVPESKKNAKSEGAVIVFEDEASFRQTPTLHATWAKRGSQPQIPTRGERHTQKIFGAVRLDNAGFIYLHQEDYFQWETYLAFLEQVVVPAFYRRHHRIYLIQDNASFPSEPSLRESLPASALLAGTECDRTNLALHAQACHTQSIL